MAPQRASGCGSNLLRWGLLPELRWCSTTPLAQFWGEGSRCTCSCAKRIPGPVCAAPQALLCARNSIRAAQCTPSLCHQKLFFLFGWCGLAASPGTERWPMRSTPASISVHCYRMRRTAGSSVCTDFLSRHQVRIVPFRVSASLGSLADCKCKCGSG